ncbi:hypothetical protein [Nocardioides aurantiacus]|uniref:hypothetical protein n=1 Tax=Nocardioides aurantiacus TaxID=86796 RepID=UPI00403F1D68
MSEQGRPDRRSPPPSGMAAPRSAPGPDGRELDLVDLAGRVCARYYEEHPDEDARYGEVGRAWCLHDNQHLLNWTALAAEGLADLDREVAWLARVLDRRRFPLDRLARDLELGGQVLAEQVPDSATLTAALDQACAMVRTRSFPPEHA